MARFGKSRTHVSYANVTATLALFVALGGGSFAVAALSGSEKKVIKKIAAKQADKRITARAPGLTVEHAGAADAAPPTGAAGGDLAGSYPNPELAPDSVGGPEVGPDALGGGEIDEATLFNDGSLNAADIDQASLTEIDAATVGDAGICRGVARVLGGSPAGTSVLCTAGDPGDIYGVLTLRLECESSGGTTTARLKLETTEDDSFFDTADGTADQVWNVADGPKTILTVGDTDTGSVNGSAGEMTSFVAAAPAVGDSVVNFAPSISAQMAGTAMVSAVENFAPASTTDFCHAALGLTAYPAL